MSGNPYLQATGLLKSKPGLGTAPVFFTAISTILGAIMFLRFGYAVGNVGFLGTVTIIAIGHLVTIPTALALAEIATNQRVAGGGEYYIISRSFGFNIGAAIGVPLFFSQAISVAFYIIAFAEAFDPIFRAMQEQFGLDFLDKRLVSLPAVLGLAALILTKGANLGLKALYAVVAVLGLSLVMFFLGTSDVPHQFTYQSLVETVDNPDSFFLVFAICFPAFTGMTAGVGLSGDLKDPSRAIPYGTLSATILGMLVYVAIAYKLAVSATPDVLSTDQFVMSHVALWGPIIPIGLACATISSALGSALVAPRTLQALAGDGIFPTKAMNKWLARGQEASNEPRQASMIVFAIAVAFVAVGDVNFVAQIISMFFMVTYGSICLISFLEHFAADPSYRPVFRSRWWISLAGAVMCLWLMFKMSTPYAILSIVVLVMIYLAIAYFNPHRRGMAAIFQGAIFQISRQLQVFLQKSSKIDADRWRPSIVCISRTSFERLGAFELLRWIAHRYGFGTYIHYIEGYLSRTTTKESKETLERLVKLADSSDSNVYVDTLVSPSYTTAICQLSQLPGISGKENNMVLFEFAKKNPKGLSEIIDNYQLLSAVEFDVCILGTSDREFGYKREIHVWITPADYENVNLMIILAYVILGHPDWRNAVIKLFAVSPEAELDQRRGELMDLVKTGRLPISAQNIRLISQKPGTSNKQIVNEQSKDADLTIIGFVGQMVRHQKSELFQGYDEIGSILFVNTTKEIDLVDTREDEISPEDEEGSEAASEEAPEGGEEAPAADKPATEKEPVRKSARTVGKNSDTRKSPLPS